jgi:hypothetical protein
MRPLIGQQVQPIQGEHRTQQLPLGHSLYMRTVPDLEDDINDLRSRQSEGHAYDGGIQVCFIVWVIALDSIVCQHYGRRNGEEHCNDDQAHDLVTLSVNF